MNNRIFAYGIGLTTLLMFGGGTIWAFSRKHQKKQEGEFQDFREKLEKVKEPEKIKKSELSAAFDPSYWKGASSVITAQKASELAKAIHNAWGFFDDDEMAIYEAFEDHSVLTYSDVSRIAENYRSKTIAGIDLWEDLSDRLSDDEMAEVKRIVAGKESR